MKKLILIKFGGSLITDKTKVNVARHDVIEDLAKQIKDVIRQSQMQSDKISKKNLISYCSIIIATGAGGFGHPVAKKYENDLKAGHSYIKEAVKKINNVVVSSLKKVGVKAESAEPSKFAKYKNGKMIALSHGFISSLIENNVIPVFHADLVDDQQLGISILSMDKFLVDTAIYLKNKSFRVKKVIFCGTTDGVLDKQGKTIDKINKKNIAEFNNIFYDNNTIDISGGMEGKMEECLKLADQGIAGIVINGQVKNNLRGEILGKKITKTTVTDYRIL